MFMHIVDWMKQEKINQSHLGRIIKRDRVRAHRIVKGAKPDDDEMDRIYKESNGSVTPNDFYKLPKIKQTHPKPPH